MENSISKSVSRVILGLGSMFIALLLTTGVFAQSSNAIEISKHWVRATPPAAKVAGGFMVVTNRGTTDDRLIAVSFEGAKKSEIHEMKIDDGIMKMRPLADGIVVPAGKSIELKPGGFHLMFMGLKQQLKADSIAPVTLTFKNAGKIDLDFPVLPMKTGKNLMQKVD